MPIFEILVGIVALLAGAVASVAGFGIGSLLTPLLALRTGTKLAVALVSIPHVLGTAVRFWQLKGHVDRRVFLSFGLMSATGGLGGALLHVWFQSRVLTWLLASLLVFAGVTGLFGLAQRLRFRGELAWVAGALSGRSAVWLASRAAFARRRCSASTCRATPSWPRQPPSA